MNHVRQQNKAVTTIKERETRKTEIERSDLCEDTRAV